MGEGVCVHTLGAEESPAFYGCAEESRRQELVPLQVRHVADRLQRDFTEKIDLSDLDSRPDSERDSAFLSRALAAIALQNLIGCNAEQAAACIIDGQDDNGIDAIAVDMELPHLWVVQAKWSDKGRASLDQASALKLHRGITLLQDGQYDEFNARFQKVADAVDQAINTAGVRITVVVALLGSATISNTVQADLERTMAQLNELEPLAELKILNFHDFYEIVRAGINETKIDLEVRLESWGQLSEPYRAFYGTMPVHDVAEWYATNGERLFTQNIRRSLGLTEVNLKLRTTLSETPENFWYFNNGITVLCDSLRKTHRGSTNAAGDFHLTGASVVNGAQTVAGIHDSVSKDREGTAAGRVWVRLISLEDCPPEFSREVTEATNTQNQIEARDFAVLDPVQAKIRDDFALSLGKAYVFKRGESEPEPSTGCSVVEAARALACAQEDPVYAARAKHDSAVLWETGPKGTYHVLFGQTLGAYRVWRCVEILRAVKELLSNEQSQRTGRAATVTAQADLLVTHLVFRRISLNLIDDPSVEWETELKKVPNLVPSILDRLTVHVDATYGVGSFLAPTFRNSERCSQLAALVRRKQMLVPVPLLD